MISFFKACGSADFLTALAASLAVVLGAVFAGVAFLIGFFADFAGALAAEEDTLGLVFLVLTKYFASFFSPFLAEDRELELLRVLVLVTEVCSAS